jgi:hypothetical protein
MLPSDRDPPIHDGFFRDVDRTTALPRHSDGGEQGGAELTGLRDGEGETGDGAVA